MTSPSLQLKLSDYEIISIATIEVTLGIMIVWVCTSTCALLLEALGLEKI